MNFLEQLAAEWYEFDGYFVRRNVLVGARPQGGYAGELDVVGFHPIRKKVIHVEATMDTLSWAQREERFARKFSTGATYIPKLFAGLDFQGPIEQIALMGYGSTATRTTLGGGQIVLVSDFLKNIVNALNRRSVATQAVPEQYGLLRSIQFVCEHQEALFNGKSG